VWDFGLLIAAGLLLLPPIADRVVGLIGRLGKALDRRGAAGALFFAGLVATALFALTSTKAYYTLRLGVLDFDRAYPTNLGSNAALKLGRAVFGGLTLVEPLRGPKDAQLALLSLVCAVPWALACWGLAGRLVGSARRLPLALLLLATPATALFAGHREIYFVPGLATMLTAWAAVSDLQEDRLPWRTSLAAGFALSAHLLAIAVLPLWLWTSRAGSGNGPGRRILASLAPALALWLGLAAWLWFGPWKGLGPPDNAFLVWGSLAHLTEGHGGLFWTGLDPQSPGGLLSAKHGIEWLNLLIFQVPQLLALAVLGGFAARRSRSEWDRPRTALALLALGALAVSVVDRPFGGHLYQWSHNANLATSAGLLTTALWSLWPAGRGWRIGCGALLAVSGYRTVSFLVLNHLGPPF
jgi:hypothetical protein